MKRLTTEDGKELVVRRHEWLADVARFRVRKVKAEKGRGAYSRKAKHASQRDY